MAARRNPVPPPSPAWAAARLDETGSASLPARARPPIVLDRRPGPTPPRSPIWANPRRSVSELYHFPVEDGGGSSYTPAAGLPWGY